MVNNNNLKPIIENKKPFEIVYELKDYEVKKSPLSVAARAKVIKRNGSNYQSSRMDSRDIALMQMYGPGFWDDFLKPIASGVLMAASVFPPTAAIALPITVGVAGTGLTVAGIGHVTDCKELKDFGKDLVGIAAHGKDAHDVADGSGLNAYAQIRNQRS